MTQTFRAILSHYPARKRQSDTLWTRALRLTLSVPPTWLFLRWRLGPLVATGLSTAIGLVACGLLFVGGPGNLLSGALLINVSYLFDLVDGNVARMTGRASRLGEFADASSGQIIGSFQFLCAGVGLARSPDVAMRALAGDRLADASMALLFAGALCAVSFLLTRLVSTRYRLIFAGPEIATSRSIGSHGGRRSAPTRFAARLGEELFSQSGFVMPGLVAAAWAGGLSLLLLANTLVALLALMAVLSHRFGMGLRAERLPG